MPPSPGFLDRRAPGGLAQSPSDEFIRHPNNRLIAAFFLGWLFFYCAQCLASRITTRFIRPVASRLFPTSSASPVDIEHNSNVHEKGRKLSLTNDMPVPSTQSLPAQDTHPILISALFLCFAFASIAHIASLVGFDIKGSGSGCAFLVAWGTMSASTAPQIALFVTSLELRQLGTEKVEIITFWAIQCISIAFTFVTASIGTGFTTPVESLGISLCYRKHFLPSSLVTSFLNIGLILYLILRLVLHTCTFGTLYKKGIVAAQDLRIIRSFSLLVLELLTLAPNSIPTSTLGEFIPFTIGSVFVIATFDHDYYFSKTSFSFSVATNGLPSDGSPLPMPPVLALDIPSSTVNLSENPVLQPFFPNHPYAAAQPTPTPRRLSAISTRRSDLSEIVPTGISGYTFNTAMAQSIAGAQVQSASRLTLTLQQQRSKSISVPSLSNNIEDVGEKLQRSSSRLQGYGKILSSQVQYAEMLENEDAALSARRISRVPGLSPGPVRPLRPRIAISSNLEPAEDAISAGTVARRTTLSPSSAIVYGSDIIRLNSSNVVDRTKQRTSRTSRASWSPFEAAPRSPNSVFLDSGMMSPASRSNTARHSIASSFALRSASNGRVFDGIHGFHPRPQRSRTFGSEGRSPGLQTDSSSSEGHDEVPPMPTSSRGVGLSGMTTDPRLGNTRMIRGPRPPPVAISREGVMGRSSHYASVHFWPSSAVESVQQPGSTAGGRSE